MNGKTVGKVIGYLIVVALACGAAGAALFSLRFLADAVRSLL